jgi:hypothetical protein
MKKSFIVYLDEAVHIAVKVRAAQEGRRISQVVEAAINLYMGGYNANKTRTKKADADKVEGKAVYPQAPDYTATVPAMRQTGGTTASS